jgi:Fe-Mn family superoxide dismutase
MNPRYPEPTLAPVLETKSVTRRHFLKASGLALSSLLLASSGLGTLSSARLRPSPIEVLPPLGVAKRFTRLENGIEGLSAHQIQAHLKLYEGYVKKHQSIVDALKQFSPEALDGVNATYHPFRELLIEESFALNGVLLHEAYFENLSPVPQAISASLQSKLIKAFGSLEAFKVQCLAAAKSMRGWAILAYHPRYQSLNFYGLDTHNTYAPMGALPVLVLDVYEHAYLLDYGTDRSRYLDALWQQIDWSVVEARLDSSAL